MFCQNKKFGCDWQGIYGDCAEHLAKSCFAVQPEQLLKRLEASEKYGDALCGQLAASRVAIDKLKEENAKMKEEVGAVTKQARDRLAQKYILEAEVAQLQEDGSRMLIDLKRMEDENLYLRGRNHAQYPP